MTWCALSGCTRGRQAARVESGERRGALGARPRNGRMEARDVRACLERTGPKRFWHASFHLSVNDVTHGAMNMLRIRSTVPRVGAGDPAVMRHPRQVLFLGNGIVPLVVPLKERKRR